MIRYITRTPRRGVRDIYEVETVAERRIIRDTVTRRPYDLIGGVHPCANVVIDRDPETGGMSIVLDGMDLSFTQGKTNYGGPALHETPRRGDELIGVARENMMIVSYCRSGPIVRIEETPPS